MFFISSLTVMGCFSPDWSDKNADFLITQLKSNRDHDLRRKAIYLLARKTQERDKIIPALTHVLLNDEFEHIRIHALDALGSIEPPAVSAIPALIEALRHEDTGVELVSHSQNRFLRRDVIELLREMGPAAAEAIPALTEVFRCGKWYLRNDAALSILKIDPSMRNIVREELIERRAVWPLAELAEQGDVSLVPVLIQLLNDPDPPHSSTHYRAAKALKEIGTPEALAAVEKFEKSQKSK